MDVRMMLEFLVPGVQDTEETDFGAELLRVSCDLKQRLGAGLEQKGVDLAFVLQRQRGKLAGQGKDHVDIARGQQFFFPRLEPAVAGVGLTSWAMPIAAGVERDGLMSASRTRMSADRGRAATQNRVQVRSKKKLSPAARITSATSTGGRGIYFVPSPVS